MAMICTACDAAASTTCTICTSALCAAHVHMGQPFISARQLVTTTATTALRAPSVLSDLLFSELDMVPYCASCREELAAKRTTEQLKFLLALVLVLALVLGLPTYLMFVG